MCLLAFVLIGFVVVLPPHPVMAETIVIRLQGFEELRKGSASDSGANLYVSHRGRVQTINRWDLNLDGELDLLFTQDHDSVYNPDSLIYWGSQAGFRSLFPEQWQLRAPFSLLRSLDAASSSVQRLPTQGGGRGLVEDLNRDGFPDILFCNFMHNYRPDQNAYIYWGSASGFDPVRRTELPAYLASGVAVADLNGDGLLDVVLANQGDELGEYQGYRFHLESYIYWGDLRGFAPSLRSIVPTVSARDVAVGDFNGDGAPDLAFANYNSQVRSCYIYWGDERGGYDPASRQELGPKQLRLDSPDETDGNVFPGMTTLLSTDLDQDGISDLVAAGTHNGVVFFGSSQGLHTEAASTLPCSSCKGLAAADLNGDGRSDLVFANEGRRGGSPTPSTIFWSSPHGFSSDDRTDLPTLGATTVQTADLNQDGQLDILFGNSFDSRGSDVPSYIYWGDSGGFSPHHRSQLSGFGVAGSAVADLNRDGNPDILLVSHFSGRSSTLPSAVYWGNREHRYSDSSVSFLEPGGSMEYSIADLDDDGFPDIVLNHRDGPAVWWGGPDGHQPEHRTSLGMKAANSSSVADLNRDGYLDLVLTLPTGPGKGSAQGGVIWGNGRRFDEARVSRWDLGGWYAESTAVADLNRDGHLDLVFPMGYADESEVFWGSDAGFGLENRTVLEAYGAAHAVAADLDGDGWLDLILTNGSTPKSPTTHNPILIYWGSPKGFSKNSRIELEGYTSIDASVADLNGDGHLDIALTNYKADNTRALPAFVYWGDGGRDYGKHRRQLLRAASSSAVDALDLDRDGSVDLVVSNHQEDFDHAAGTNIFWGSPEGLSWSRRSHLPTVGVHLDAMVDSGNVYDRRYQWDYVSPPLEAPSAARFRRLSWSGETPHGTGLRFQVRTAARREDLDKADWLGPRGRDSFYLKPGSKLAETHAQSWLQYRVVFTSPDGGNSAILTEVSLECESR